MNTTLYAIYPAKGLVDIHVNPVGFERAFNATDALSKFVTEGTARGFQFPKDLIAIPATIQ